MEPAAAQHRAAHVPGSVRGLRPGLVRLRGVRRVGPVVVGGWVRCGHGGSSVGTGRPAAAVTRAAGRSLRG
ncbi:hypothetical protein SFR_3154 [Streptomyces sp. FR-008]|nr:hypothetical protein SFR_3154 [Streptomyces sp. FR-008]